jgi:hypothetical protein
MLLFCQCCIRRCLLGSGQIYPRGFSSVVDKARPLIMMSKSLCCYQGQCTEVPCTGLCIHRPVVCPTACTATCSSTGCGTSMGVSVTSTCTSWMQRWCAFADSKRKSQGCAHFLRGRLHFCGLSTDNAPCVLTMRLGVATCALHHPIWCDLAVMHQIGCHLLAATSAWLLLHGLRVPPWPC